MKTISPRGNLREINSSGDLPEVLGHLARLTEAIGSGTSVLTHDSGLERIGLSIGILTHLERIGQLVFREIATDSDGESQFEIELTPAGVWSFRSPQAQPRPTWDAQRRELRVHGKVVRRFRVPAPNQTRILTAFAEADWPSRIPNPTPLDPWTDPKKRLRDTLRSLNAGLRVLRFRGDGTGEGILWESSKVE